MIPAGAWGSSEYYLINICTEIHRVLGSNLYPQCPRLAKQLWSMPELSPTYFLIVYFLLSSSNFNVSVTLSFDNCLNRYHCQTIGVLSTVNYFTTTTFAKIGHITVDGSLDRGRQCMLWLVRVLVFKLSCISKQVPTFPLQVWPGIELRICEVVGNARLLPTMPPSHPPTHTQAIARKAVIH